MLLAESYKIQTENHSNSNNIETTTMTDGKDEMQPTQITTAAVSQFDAIDNEVVSTLIYLDVSSFSSITRI
jgi:hypothetical protein